MEWLSYTYLFIRMLANPMVYGIPYGAKEVESICIELFLQDFILIQKLWQLKI